MGRGVLTLRLPPEIIEACKRGDKVEMVLKPYKNPVAVMAEFRATLDRGKRPSSALCAVAADILAEPNLSKVARRWRDLDWVMIADFVGSEHKAAKLIYDADAAGGLDQESVRKTIRRRRAGTKK